MAVTHRFKGRYQLIELIPEQPPFAGERLLELGLRGLHCGSARKLFPGWLNTDMLHITDAERRASAPDRIARMDGELYYLEHDAADPFPFLDGSFDWVFAEHFIEHLPFASTVGWLREMRRLLRPGGHLRLSTPDLRRYVEGYLDPAGAFFREHRERLERTREFAERSVPARRAWMVNQIFQKWQHEWIYDFDEVRLAAVRAGFSEDSVRECSYGTGRLTEVCALDLPGRSDESLYVEIDRA
jgi:predicted SAM-dependent methyltransferase